MVQSAEVSAGPMVPHVEQEPLVTCVAMKRLTQMVQNAEGNAGPMAPFVDLEQHVTCVAMAVSVPEFVGHACPTTRLAVLALHVTIVATQHTMRTVRHAEDSAGPMAPFVVQEVPVICAATRPTMRMVQSVEDSAGPMVSIADWVHPVTCAVMAVSVLVSVVHACRTAFLAVPEQHVTIVATQHTMQMALSAEDRAGKMVPFADLGQRVTYAVMEVSVLAFAGHACPTTHPAVLGQHVTIVATQPTMPMVHNAVVLVGEGGLFAALERRAICVVMDTIGGHNAFNAKISITSTYWTAAFPLSYITAGNLC